MAHIPMASSVPPGQVQHLTHDQTLVCLAYVQGRFATTGGCLDSYPLRASGNQKPSENSCAATPQMLKEGKLKNGTNRFAPSQPASAPPESPAGLGCEIRFRSKLV
jgi:hypothetical protein